jgi:hypothetical protein
MDGGKWKAKRDPVLIAEYKLMDRKEQKLRTGIAKDSKLVDKQREKLGMTVEALNSIEDGYYKRYIQKEPLKVGKNVSFFNKHPTAKDDMRSKPHGITKPKHMLSVKSFGTRLSQLGQEHMSIQTASSKRKQTTYENCGSYPNTAHYIKRILDPKEYLHLTSNRSNGALDDLTAGNKSQDRRRVSLDDESAPHSEAAVHKQATSYSRRAGSANRTGRPALKANAKGSERLLRASSQQEDAEPQPQYLDLVEYLVERQSQQEQAEINAEMDPQEIEDYEHFEKSGHHKGVKNSDRIPKSPQNDVSYSQESKERLSVAKSTHIHPKQVSYENALKLREGKIFAKFDRELKIYDLRDLDCKIGVDIHLLHRK